ncbi:MAG: NAD(P)-dependent oxidoreductase [Rhodospirillaceae bacterium]|nr:NAD(P)-dependent oxidoreductase [Rhodospirillaceae bacterium]MYH38871.1 NAD(P)-dependent oxidoreductase [Rhodospirillaceae bacterium]MYK13258.1 NAD(P)-dependent oxidoreductase [Rhodospirillaceae bacterium]
MPPSRETVGFVGLGNMGRPMAACLARVGFGVVGYDADPLAAEAFAGETGCRAAPTLAALAEAATVAVTMLPTGAIVRRVLLEEEQGALASGLGVGRSGGGLVLDMSSSEPVGTRALGEALAERGVALVDAPVSGGVERAGDGTLAIMIGADDAAAAERAEPVLRAMGDRLFRAGPLGAGHAAKALNNYAAAAAFTAAAEALIVGEAFGLERETLLTIINNSSGRSFNSEVPMKQEVLPRTFATGFKLGLMAKDVAIAADLADALGADAPLSRYMKARWGEASDALGADADFTRAVTLWEPA